MIDGQGTGRLGSDAWRRTLENFVNSPEEGLARQAKAFAFAPNTLAEVMKANRSIEELMHGVNGAGAFATLREAMQHDSLAELKAKLFEPPTVSAHRTIAETFADMDRANIEALAGLSATAKATQWADALAPLKQDMLSELVRPQAGILEEIGRITRDAEAILGGIGVAERAKMQAAFGFGRPLVAELGPTALKMSLLAGAVDTFGFAAPSVGAAYHALLGEWRTRPDLPARFWRDPGLRRRRYRAAEVDPGLSEADAATTLDIMVESGLLAGARGEAGAIAVIEIGPVRMTIASRGTRVDAFRAVDAFEAGLRAYIAGKLEAIAGEDWFKARTPPGLLGKAKGNRTAAMKRGEAYAPLIHFVDLGDLIGIVTRTDNWDQVFGTVFINRTEFDLDMQRLVATRRPTMHARTVDGPRLVELLCVIERLLAQMSGDGAWLAMSERDD